MRVWIIAILSALGSSLGGSLILWIVLSLLPGSNAGFSPVLYLYMVVFSSVVITASVIVITLLFFPCVKRLQIYSPKGKVIRSAIAGGLVYLGICVVVFGVKLEGAMIWKFLISGIFLVPIGIGAIYGGAFGFAFGRIGERLH